MCIDVRCMGVTFSLSGDDLDNYNDVHIRCECVC